ncbi:hypothetical protein BT69DRAFT_1284424 [Atractiella rhizophila]|nr:hypothetical protein BT69DRAFT_1284424 [Atractiella rhizophila]
MVQELHVLFLHLAGSDRSYRVFGDGKVLLNLIYPHFQRVHAIRPQFCSALALNPWNEVMFLVPKGMSSHI